MKSRLVLSMLLALVLAAGAIPVGTAVAGRTVKGPVKLGIPAPGHIDPLLIGSKLHWYEVDGGKTAFYTVELSKL
jgi:hypothetical protein